MARAKKEAALTPEERLQAALVPDWEWPYKLPENWCWTRMQEIAQWGSGGTPSRKVSEYYNGDIPWVKTGELNDDYIFETEEHITQEAISHSSAKIYPTDTVVIAMYGATIGKVGILGIPAATNQACACAIVKPSTDYKYLFYYAQSQKDDFIKKGKGGAQPNISQEIIKFHQFPLPPLAEQQRIVDRIESLFAKLDEAKEKTQAVVDSFETRKAAILHKAFTGELTAKWRRTHGLSLDTWKEVAADFLFEYVTSGSRGWAKYYDESGAVFIRMGNLNHGTIELDFSDIQHVKLPNKAEGQRSRIRKNDILISITADVGMVGLVRNDDFEGYINQHIALARPVMSESAEFIAWYLVSDIGLKQMQEKQRGATKVGLSLNDIRALQLKIPLIEEQNEILKVIKMWIEKEQQSQEAAEAVLDQIDLMKKSILARAFRGELGTNDPTEESAVELLKKIIQ